MKTVLMGCGDVAAFRWVKRAGPGMRAEKPCVEKIGARVGAAFRFFCKKNVFCGQVRRAAQSWERGIFFNFYARNRKPLSGLRKGKFKSGGCWELVKNRRVTAKSCACLEKISASLITQIPQTPEKQSVIDNKTGKVSGKKKVSLITLRGNFLGEKPCH